MLKKGIIVALLLILLIGGGLFIYNRIQNQPLPLSAECAVEPEILTTADGIEFVRTPDACFENLPDWDYEPKYVEIDGLRQAYIDEGPAEQCGTNHLGDRCPRADRLHAGTDRLVQRERADG